jgi:sugar phosphate permease
MQVLSRIWSRLFPNPTYYGWAIVGLGFLSSALTSPGQSFVISLYLEPVMADLGLSRVEISSLYAMATLAAAACLPLVGSWADRIPSGRFLGGVLGLIALAMAGFSAVRTVAALAVAFFFLRLLAQGAIGLGTLTATVRWFRRYRGRALAVVGLGYAFGQLVYPGVIYGLVEWLGWRGSLLAMAGVYLLVAAPLVGRLMRERRPGDAPIDGSELIQDGTEPVAEMPEVSFSLRQALRMPVFWGLLLCLAIPPLVHTAVIFHQVALFTSVGWGASLVPPAFMASALAGVVMTYATGLLLEKVPSRMGIALSLGLSAVALSTIGLPLSIVAGALLYGTLLGLASGANAATNSIVWPDYFGIEALGAVKGVVNAVRNGATALGPPIAAVLVAASGSFASSLVAFALASAAGAFISVWLRKPVVHVNGAAEEHTRETLANRSGIDRGRAA